MPLQGRILLSLCIDQIYKSSENNMHSIRQRLSWSSLERALLRAMKLQMGELSLEGVTSVSFQAAFWQKVPSFRNNV